MTPLFIPLKTEYYRLFENGYKTHEYRPYGKRWNERVCAIGRDVTLSRGYSTPDRLTGHIVGFRQLHRKDLPTPEAYNAWLDCYGPEMTVVADIEIEVRGAGRRWNGGKRSRCPTRAGQTKMSEPISIDVVIAELKKRAKRFRRKSDPFSVGAESNLTAMALWVEGKHAATVVRQAQEPRAQ